jgi:ABC-type transport system involved in Fe-S cluster assembly fused permease/ATPase subunit
LQDTVCHTDTIPRAFHNGAHVLPILLCRFYDVEEGSVLVGGHDVRQLQMGSLRHAMASVPQDMVLFNDSIYYNIAYGSLGASREAVEAAAKAAQVRCVASFSCG